MQKKKTVLCVLLKLEDGDLIMSVNDGVADWLCLRCSLLWSKDQTRAKT